MEAIIRGPLEVRGFISIHYMYVLNDVQPLLIEDLDEKDPLLFGILQDQARIVEFLLTIQMEPHALHGMYSVGEGVVVHIRGRKGNFEQFGNPIT